MVRPRRDRSRFLTGDRLDENARKLFAPRPSSSLSASERSQCGAWRPPGIFLLPAVHLPGQAVLAEPARPEAVRLTAVDTQLFLHGGGCYSWGAGEDGRSSSGFCRVSRSIASVPTQT